jgi:hypothetical protein
MNMEAMGIFGNNSELLEAQTESLGRTPNDKRSNFDHSISQRQ